MKPLVRIAQFLVICGAIAINARAQNLVTAREVPAAIRVLDSAPPKNPLPCDIQISKKPRLDFIFRYTAGFSIACRLGLIQPGTTLFALIRITPQNSRPVLMVQEFYVPAIPLEKLTRFYSVKINKLQISMSGGFAVGLGRYLVEVDLTDQRGHTCRKKRALKADEDKTAQTTRTALDPGAVAPLLEARWDGKLASSGLRLTVFLHAYNPGGARIYAWHRAYLLQSLTALLTYLPCQSVKLVAFNLDRQEELFREDGFDANGFVKLEKALDGIELVTVPYQVLMSGAWARFLVEMAQKEATSKEPPDAIIFLGPWGSHTRDMLPKDLVRTVGRSDTRFFYLKYWAPPYPPDGLERLTNGLHGATFTVRSPETLAQAIKKMLVQINAARKN